MNKIYFKKFYWPKGHLTLLTLANDMKETVKLSEIRKFIKKMNYGTDHVSLTIVPEVET